MSGGIKVPFVPTIITPKIERPLRKSLYEAREAEAVRRMLQPGDRVLELGAGLGLLSTVAGLVPGIESVTTVEANPGLLPLIRETHRLNGATVTLLHGVASASDGPEVDFYLRADFWGSSMEPDSRPFDRVVQLPRVGVTELAAKLRPTVLICDIEGGELGLFDAVDMASVRTLVIELHPKVYGRRALDGLYALFRAKGFAPAEGALAGAVQILHRAPTVVSLAAPAPSAAIVAEVASDGPWLLEWVAWHRAAGLGQIVLFSNGADSATLALLDRLDAMGVVQHLPHPGPVWGTGADALAYARELPALRQADFVLPLAVDEFLNIRTGDHSLGALLDATGPFDVLSALRVGHGANGRVTFQPGWVTETLPRHKAVAPDATHTLRCLVRRSERLVALGPHRPILASNAAVWLDGAGRPTSATETPSAADALVRIEHFPVRDLETVLSHHCSDNGTSEGRKAFKKAWRGANHNQADDAAYGAMVTAARNWMAAHLAPDTTLMALHDAACKAHANRLAAFALAPVFQSRWKWATTEGV